MNVAREGRRRKRDITVFASWHHLSFLLFQFPDRQQAASIKCKLTREKKLISTNGNLVAWILILNTLCYCSFECVEVKFNFVY